MRIGIALLLIPALAAAQEPVFRSNMSVVEVPVVAKDSKESPVTDLIKYDVRVFDNGVEQTILSFDKLGGVVQSTGRPMARLSIIVLDSLNTSWETQAPARMAVSRMIGELPPGPDKLVIFALGDTLHLLHDSSRDKASLRAAVDRYAGERPQIGAEQASSRAGFDAQHPPRPDGTGGKGPMASMPPRSPGANVSDAAFYSKPRLDLTLAALQEVARIVKDVPGVKPLMWVTAGFRPPSGSHEDLARAMRDLAAAKVMLYPVDARGVLPEIHAFTDAQNLGEFAEQTGGRAYFNNNDTAAFLRAALEDSREGYLLTYAPRDYRQDGSDHKVRLDSSRKGVTLRYRPGYVADHAP